MSSICSWPIFTQCVVLPFCAQFLQQFVSIAYWLETDKDIWDFCRSTFKQEKCLTNGVFWTLRRRNKQLQLAAKNSGRVNIKRHFSERISNMQKQFPAILCCLRCICLDFPRQVYVTPQLVDHKPLNQKEWYKYLRTCIPEFRFHIVHRMSGRFPFFKWKRSKY